MRKYALFVVLLGGAIQGFCQAAPTASAGLPKDPAAILAAAAPFYDFSDPTLKPWHLKAKYQLYDEKGKPSEQGTYEYWWASPDVHRSSWTRVGATHTEWHTADGRSASEDSGRRISFFEQSLETALLSPLPDEVHLEPAKIELGLTTIAVDGATLPCVTLTLKSLSAFARAPQWNGKPSAYCFDTRLPILKGVLHPGFESAEYGDFVKMQGLFLPRAISLLYEARTVIAAKVEILEPIEASDDALTPTANAAIAEADRVQVDPEIAESLVISKAPASYLPDVAAGLDGVVLLDVTVGPDGKVHITQVIQATNNFLSESAQKNVSIWRYKPYTRNGKPVEMETLVRVRFVNPAL